MSTSSISYHSLKIEPVLYVLLFPCGLRCSSTSNGLHQNRFKELASIFFDHQFDDCLNEQVVKSPSNAIILAEELVNALDEGRMAFQHWFDGQV